ncbi:GNAT family N-acetyltransferase [Enterovibrio coralii]|uniref:Acetyltransferase n=1 Tax=Enterovibrio coralii TaxID=294935 RepID=A0A135ICY5_9GAMM|nr:GNAT family N-acetyltransferase [Enterovibrio coralii]KXF83323.1 acetyltransferase [Enterovibrio coralii]
MSLELRSINHQNFYEICQLEVTQSQQHHVDSNAISLAEANFMKFPWYKGIYYDNKPVGFILVNANTVSGKFELWRFMLDKSQQSKGYGRKAIGLLKLALVAEYKISALYTSVVSGLDSPKDFYINCGFVPTGHSVEDREIELYLTI